LTVPEVTPATGRPGSHLTLVAQRLFDSLARCHRRDWAVRIEGDSVTYVGPRTDVGDSEALIDLGEATIVPGLIDAHVHLAWDPWADAHETCPPRRRVAQEAIRNAALHLDRGVTAVRDLGAPSGGVVEAAAVLAADPGAGPFVVAAGLAIGSFGGHAPAIARQVNGPVAIAEAAATEIEAGAGVVKLMASGGVLGRNEDPDDVQLGELEIRAAAAVARAARRRVAVHAHARGAITAAVRARVSSIEHGSQLEEGTAAAMAATGICLVPTIAPLRNVCERGVELGLPKHVLAKAPVALAGVQEAVATARAAGVEMVPGTDAGVPGQEHGSLVSEIEEFAAGGMPAADCLAAATLGGARLLDLPDRGRLAVGACADLIVVDGDPLRELRRLKAPRAVIRAGRLVRGSLD
jgi:imidazolonepropionase-like amidohydrolase